MYKWSYAQTSGMKSSLDHMLQNSLIEVISWFHISDDSVHDSPSPDSRFTHLTNANITL